MSYCLNPHCESPQNREGTRVCRACGSILLLKGRYRAIRELGEGGMSCTFLAVDEEQQEKPCVIKQFSPHAHKTVALHKATELFNQEALRLRELGEHDQIPSLFDHFEQEKCLYLIEEFVNGQNLLQELREFGAFSEEKIRQILLNLLPILDYIHHHNIIHRDIKPENIIRRQTDQKLVLVDFGVAKQSPDIFQPKTGTMTGTVGYAPLEQIRGGKAYPASDLYSLGVTCIHLLTHVTPNELFDPFSGELIWRSHLQQSGRNISFELSQILDKLLQDIVQNRYQSAQNVLQDLTHIHPIFTISIQPETPLQVIVNTELEAIKTELKSRRDFREFFLPHDASNDKLFSQLPASEASLNASPIFKDFTPLFLINPPENLSHSNFKKSLNDRQCFKILKGHKSAVKAIVISPQGYLLVSGSTDQTIRLWNLKTGQTLHQFKGHQAAVNTVAISPNGRKLISGSLDRTILAWNLNSRTMTDRFFSHSGSPYSHRDGEVYAVAYSPDGNIIASGSADHTLKLWNQRNGELLYRLYEHTDVVLCVTFTQPDLSIPPLKIHPDSCPKASFFASGSADGKIKIWQFGRFRSLRTLIGHHDQVCCLAISQDQTILASGSVDQTVKLWNFQTGELLTTLTQHSDIVSSVAISPDGQLLASGSQESGVQLWDISNRNNFKHLGVPIEHLDGYPPVAFTPDSKMLVTGGENGDILIWQLGVQDT